MVKEKGLQSLRQSSLNKKEGKDKFLAGLNSDKVHDACTKNYVNDRMIAAPFRKYFTGTNIEIKR